MRSIIRKTIPLKTRRTIRKWLGIKAHTKEAFLNPAYRRHTQRRQEHLASLGLPLANSTVLEVGAGMGDHTSFFLDRGCQVVSTEARPENLDELRAQYPDLNVRQLDLENPDPTLNETFDIIYCYGLLYHLGKPAEAIEFMAKHCGKMLLLETCVSFGDEEAINLCVENAENVGQSASGQGCRPTRSWVYRELKKHFEHVYLPTTQPNHEEFPLDWTSPHSGSLSRAVFIASRHELESPVLVEAIPMQQIRH